MIFFFSFNLAEQNEIGAVCLGLNNCLFSKSWLSVWLFYTLQTILAWELAHHQVPALKETGCWWGSECITRGQGLGEKCDGEVRPGWVGARAPWGWRWGVRRGLRESWGCVCVPAPTSWWQDVVSSKACSQTLQLAPLLQNFCLFGCTGS